VVNIEEKIGKTVGKRRAGDPLVVPAGDKKQKRAWQKAGFFPKIKKGVYCFKTFEEADKQWMQAITAGPKGN
jgi:hypothetical protein